MRKTILSMVSVLAIGLAASGCGSAGSSSGSSDALKIALIPPTSGALAQFGADAVKGWQIAADQANAKGGIDGHKVQLIKMSTDGKSATTLRAARKAVTKNGAGFIGAVMTSTEHAALHPQLQGLGALSFNALGKEDALTGKGCSPNSFRVIQSTSMDIRAVTESLSNLPGSKWAILAEDYSTGHNAAKSFKTAANKAGKQVVSVQFAPLNTTDFGSYITKVKNSGADAMFAVEYGSDAVALAKQVAQFKLPSQLKTVLGFNMVSKPLFPALGDGVKGFYNNVEYKVNSDNQINKRFVADYAKNYGSKPYYVPADNYLAAETLFAGVKKAGSIDPDKVRSALDDLTFESVDGKVTMRGADHQMLRPSYLGKVAGSGKKLHFKIISSTPPDVTSPAPDPACRMHGK